MEIFSLISYGAISQDFKSIAKLKKEMFKVKGNDIQEHRVDCYETTNSNIINSKFEKLGLKVPTNIEIFYPSDKYPAHVDEGGVSYFVGLESGNFFIDGINYPIVPFVLYAFDDAKLHNTDFCALMLK